MVRRNRGQRIEALPKRVERYGKARKSALDVAEYMQGLPGQQANVSQGDGLRGLPSVPALLHRGQGEVARGTVLQSPPALPPVRDSSRCQGSRRLPPAVGSHSAPASTLRPFLVTLTVKDGPDLAERFAHLHKAQRELWKRKQRGRGLSWMVSKALSGLTKSSAARVPACGIRICT